MSVTDDIALANTRAKLADLEARFDELRRGTAEDAHVREVTMRSLKKYINQFKEEIARYEAHRLGQNESNVDTLARRRLRSDLELENTRRKLQELETLYEANENESGDDRELRAVERSSLKRLINQFKEEIARYEAHQTAQS